MCRRQISTQKEKRKKNTVTEFIILGSKTPPPPPHPTNGLFTIIHMYFEICVSSNVQQHFLSQQILQCKSQEFNFASQSKTSLTRDLASAHIYLSFSAPNCGLESGSAYLQMHSNLYFSMSSIARRYKHNTNTTKAEYKTEESRDRSMHASTE